MLNNIFQIDWILVDIIIIIFLFLLLISVRLFKSTHRWRTKFSNDTIESFVFPNEDISYKNQFFHLKKWTLTRDSSLKENHINNPLILIFRTNYKKKLLQILTEGLCSYGFSIITARVKVKEYPEGDLMKKTAFDEVLSLISTIIDYLKKTELIIHENYILLDYSLSYFCYNTILRDSKNDGLILINPKINMKNLINFNIVIDKPLLNNSLYIIFSKKSRFFFSNKSLKYLLTKFPSQKLTRLNIMTLYKSKNSFKYYETILLGMIIDIIENKLAKLKNKN